MFVDELTITAEAGNGGNGVVRWRREKSIPFGGPAGGNGGNGGDVYVRAVKDLGILSKYTGSTHFKAKDGESGAKRSKYGAHGVDLYIDIPVGATIRNVETGSEFTLNKHGDTQKILRGGRGGLGNEYFKSSTNRSPEEATEGKKGQRGEFHIILSLIVDAGIIGLPNAGKSSLLNALTNSRAKVGSYPFTTLEPHLGDCYGYVLADIPGLIEGASEGKGLGHKFLRHVEKTKTLIHCVSVENVDPIHAYETIRKELIQYNPALTQKPEIVVLTKIDVIGNAQCETISKQFLEKNITVFPLSIETGKNVKEFRDYLHNFFIKLG